MADDRETSTRPSTSSVLWGEWRRGLKDLQNAVLNPWNGITATHEEPGTIATPTQAQVTQDVGTVHGFNAMLDGYADRGNQSQGRDQDRGLDRGIDR
ncbi:MAG TPA: hypothetical protein VFE62_10285 [Gemmataceae bacterium]|nr:hypothetical protein [Gemmataceae bacterium]